MPEGELSQPPEAEEAPALEETEEAGSRISGIRLAEGICQALLAAGGQERFHGGVRPDNVTVQDGQVYLGPRLKHGVGEFTPLELEYMAPELFWDGYGPQRRCNIPWAWCCIRYTIMAGYRFGRPPGGNAQHPRRCAPTPDER